MLVRTADPKTRLSHLQGAMTKSWLFIYFCCAVERSISELQFDMLVMFLTKSVENLELCKRGWLFVVAIYVWREVASMCACMLVRRTSARITGGWKKKRALLKRLFTRPTPRVSNPKMMMMCITITRSRIGQPVVQSEGYLSVCTALWLAIWRVFQSSILPLYIPPSTTLVSFVVKLRYAWFDQHC